MRLRNSTERGRVDETTGSKAMPLQRAAFDAGEDSDREIGTHDDGEIFGPIVETSNSLRCSNLWTFAMRELPQSSEDFVSTAADCREADGSCPMRRRNGRNFVPPAASFYLDYGVEDIKLS